MLGFIALYLGLLAGSFFYAYRLERSKKRRERGALPIKEELPPEEEPQTTNAHKENFNCVTWCGRTGAVLNEENV